MACAPHRIIANDRNVLRDAVLTPSSVLPVEDQVTQLPVARDGTAQALLTGAYTGVEEKRIDIEITDTIPADPIVSAPTFSGAGSSLLVDVTAVGLPSQTITIQLIDAGSPAKHAALSFEGQRLKAREIGPDGNAITIEIDQTTIEVDAEPVAALIEDLAAGSGGPDSGIDATGLDWDTKVRDPVPDAQIPANAHRVVFGNDTSAIYLQYKEYVDNRWRYHFVPELKRDIPNGTLVYFVTGGRTVTISDGVTDETYSNIVTVYDLLNAIRQTSQLVTVDGVVANDRTPTGQAARELLVRTDAHVQSTTANVSAIGGGFEVAFVNSNARTELVVIRCFAINGKDHPLARLGGEYWEVRTSIGGFVGYAVTGVPFSDPEGRFGFTIRRVLPTGYGTRRGRFSVERIEYQSREEEVEPPDICVKNMKLGTEAVDQVIELVWTKRPSGDCACAKLPAPFVGGRCLGLFEEGGEIDMAYSDANRVRLKNLYTWYADIVRANSEYVDSAGNQRGGKQDAAFSEPLVGLPYTNGFQPVPLRDVVKAFESALELINNLEPGSPDWQGEGETEWDTVVAEFKADIEAVNESGGTPGWNMVAALTDRYIARIDQVLITAGISPLGKADASILESGDGCWRDHGDPAYWAVTGELGAYAPAFVNKAYYSSRRADEESQYFSTREFGFVVVMKPDCVSQLEYGDTIYLRIGDAGFPATYQVGDRLELPVVAAGALQLVGGAADNSMQTWSVNGSDHGPFAPWQFIPGETTTGYSDDGLSFDIEERGIPNQKGDTWTLSISGGHARSRVDGGAWSAPFGILSGQNAFMDGLLLEWVPGADPPFVVGDLYSFTALQPWAVSHVRTGLPDRWKWAPETPDIAMLDMDPGEVVTLDGFMLWHTIPEGATITLRGGSTLAVSDWAEAVEWNDFLTVQPLSQVRTARYLRLDVEDGSGGSVRWLWGGEMLAMRYPADVALKPRVRAMRGSAPLSQGGAKLASSRGATVQFQEGGVMEDEMQDLLGMWEWTKGSRGDDEIEPIVVVPNINRPTEAIIGEIDQDELLFDEMFGEQPTDGALRRYTGSLSVSGLWQPRA